MSDDQDLSALYQSADKPQPPATLDETIRDAAHKAVKSKRSHAPQWLGGIAASLIAALLITQLLPTVEQAAVSTMPDNIPSPAADLAAPRLELREAAPAAAAPKSAPQKSKPERTRTDNQIMQEKIEMKRSQARKKASVRDEADAILLSEPMEKEAREALSTPVIIPSPPDTELQAIIDLLDAGKTSEAKQQLDDFRNRYPEADIPETITRRLQN